ncbi:MAG: hypothetical protein QXU03_03255 [Desulfurococcaceae archaeon]
MRHYCLARISKTCHEKVLSMALRGINTASARNMVRQLLARELKRVYELVLELLSSSS